MSIVFKLNNPNMDDEIQVKLIRIDVWFKNPFIMFNNDIHVYYDGDYDDPIGCIFNNSRIDESGDVT